MGKRDFVREMDLIIDRRTEVSSYQSRIVAQDIVSELLADDPDLLNGWLQVRAADLLHETINHRDRSRRAIGVIENRNQGFQNALDEFVNSGSREPIRSFLGVRFAVDKENNRKRLRDMNRHDLMYVSDQYVERARANGFLAALYKEIARKVGDKTVGDVFSEEQIKAMRDKFLESAD